MFLCFISCMSAREEDTLKKQNHQNIREKMSKSIILYIFYYLGLAEVVGGLGVDKLHELMPDIIRTSERSDIAPHVKDGTLLI